MPSSGKKIADFEGKISAVPQDGNKNDQFEARNLDFSTGVRKKAPKYSEFEKESTYLASRRQ
jgi:hypothetical protein